MKIENKLAVSVPEAAELLSISVSAAYALVHQGRFPIVQPGGPGHKILVPVEELREWLREETNK